MIFPELCRNTDFWYGTVVRANPRRYYRVRPRMVTDHFGSHSSWLDLLHHALRRQAATEVLACPAFELSDARLWRASGPFCLILSSA